MIKTNKGFTLTEVLVSILVLGITFATSISILSFSNKLTIANERKSNTFKELETLLEIFSSDPMNFEINLSEIYSLELNEDGTYFIYYSSAFIRKQEASPYFIKCKYIQELINDNNFTIYKLDIKVYHNGDIFIIDNQSSIILEIVKKVTI